MNRRLGTSADSLPPRPRIKGARDGRGFRQCETGRSKKTTTMDDDDITNNRLSALIRRTAERLGQERGARGFKNGEVANAAVVETMSLAGGTATQVRQRLLCFRLRLPGSDISRSFASEASSAP